MSELQMTGQQLNDLRRRVVDGEDVTEEELREAITYLHELRGNDVPKKTNGKKKEISREEAQKALDDLLKF